MDREQQSGAGKALYTPPWKRGGDGGDWRRGSNGNGDDSASQRGMRSQQQYGSGSYGRRSYGYNNNHSNGYNSGYNSSYGRDRRWRGNEDAGTPPSFERDQLWRRDDNRFGRPDSSQSTPSKSSGTSKDARDVANPFQSLTLDDDDGDDDDDNDGEAESSVDNGNDAPSKGTDGAPDLEDNAVSHTPASVVVSQADSINKEKKAGVSDAISSDAKKPDAPSIESSSNGEPSSKPSSKPKSTKGGVYVPPALRRRAEGSEPSTAEKDTRSTHIPSRWKRERKDVTMIFGDSFVGRFKLLSETVRPEVTIDIVKFKGGTAKGAGKVGHDTQAEIKSRIEKAIRRKGPVHSMLFGFGQVDVHLSYYYTKFIKPAVFEMEKIVKTYTDFAAGVCPDVKCHRAVFSVYPNPVAPERYVETLRAYGILPRDFEGEIDASDPSFAYLHRLDVLNQFNAMLKKACEERGLDFLDINDHILNEDGTMDPKFVDISQLNIHLLWEPSLQLWVDRLEKYNIYPDMFVDAETTFAEYHKYKTRELDQKGIHYGPSPFLDEIAPELASSTNNNSKELSDGDNGEGETHPNDGETDGDKVGSAEKIGAEQAAEKSDSPPPASE